MKIGKVALGSVADAAWVKTLAAAKNIDRIKTNFISWPSLPILNSYYCVYINFCNYFLNLLSSEKHS
jgi:hypothetical protein